jgi:protein-S-isoprenylcysteine O-methyltransferase Ste14
MPTAALWLWSIYGLLGFVLRVAIQLQRTGDTGLRGVTGRVGSVEWLGGVGFVAAIVIGVAAPILALQDAVEPIGALDTDALHVAGIVLYGCGLLAMVMAQGTMGASWRVGVDETERTSLVTEGPFALVRNPIYTALLTLVCGLVLLVPSVVSIAALALLVLSLELQTRFVEEPHLLHEHGPAYSSYASRVGRFLPKLGRLATAASEARPPAEPPRSAARWRP